MDYSTQLTAEEAASLRTELIEQSIVPKVRRMFDVVPEVQSAVMLVSQMWCDEALDAVHAELRYSLQPDPDLAAFMTWSRAQTDDWDDPDEGLGKEDAMTQWNRLIHLVDRHEQVAADVVNRIGDVATDHQVPKVFWDSNVAAIPAFAAFCEEDCHQEMLPGEADLPYAVFRRSAAGFDTEVVGQMIRPEQDGVPPEASIDAPGQEHTAVTGGGGLRKFIRKFLN